MDYKGPIEAALSTDLRGEPYNFSLWDIHTGTQLVAFKGIKSNPIKNCLQLIDNNYFVTAIDNVLYIWSIFNRKCQDQKLFLPGRPTTLCISPCGNYLSVGISEMMYVWQLHSGNLLAHTQRHFQSISVLKMNPEGTFLFSAGEDGVVLVWPFADLISGTHNTGALNLNKSRNDVGVNEPRYTWQHHSGQVTDIHITNGGRCITVSVDMLVNIYSYCDGKRLYCVSMPSQIWSVIMNKSETRLYLGAQDGNIYEIIVSSISLSMLNQKNGEHGQIEKKPILVGHKGKVNGLVLSVDGSRLISSSIDASCKIWDVNQRKLLQDIKHQAPLANLKTFIIPDSLALTSMSQAQAKPSLTMRPLKRNLYKQPRDTTIASDDLFNEASTTIVHLKNNLDRWDAVLTQFSHTGRSESTTSSKTNETNLQATQNGIDNPHQEDENNETVVKLKAKIRELYRLSAEKIFKDAAETSLKPYKLAAGGTAKRKRN